MVGKYATVVTVDFKGVVECGEHIFFPYELGGKVFLGTFQIKPVNCEERNTNGEFFLRVRAELNVCGNPLEVHFFSCTLFLFKYRPTPCYCGTQTLMVLYRCAIFSKGKRNPTCYKKCKILKLSILASYWLRLVYNSCFHKDRLPTFSLFTELITWTS